MSHVENNEIIQENFGNTQYNTYNFHVMNVHCNTHTHTDIFFLYQRQRVPLLFHILERKRTRRRATKKKPHGKQMQQG